MPGHRLMLLGLLLSGAPLCAHSVPTLEVEAEFTQSHTIILHVNVDARLFLAAQPGTVAPIPASWWMEQDEETRAKTMAQARAYVARTLFFTIGSTKLEPPWKVIPIDSNSMLPLAPTSVEAHLLCDYEGALPGAPGPFQVRVAENCAVGVILLNSVEGTEQRYPQSLFPGESSRRFELPGADGPSSTKAPVRAHEEGRQLHTLLVWSGVGLVAMLCLGWWLLKRARAVQPVVPKVS